MSNQAPPKKRSCWFYGCITLAVLVLIASIAMFFIGRYLYNMVENFTSSEPLKIEQVVLPPEEMTNLLQRVAKFGEALEKQETPEELSLSASELNALIAQNEDFADKVLVQIKDDKITGQISLPLSAIGLNGKYLNGEATFKPTITDGRLQIHIDEAQVNGQSLPDAVAKEISQQDFAKELNDPELRETIAKVESIEIKDGRVILKNRISPPPQPTEPSTEER